jgi:hypothetical protein
MTGDVQYRQGDVLLIRCAAMPADADPVEPENGRVVLAYGEVSGHSHAMPASRVRYFREDGSGRAFIRVSGPGPAGLSHEEHGTIEVGEGVYEVRQQREYRPKDTPMLIED